MMVMMRSLAALLLAGSLSVAAFSEDRGAPWARHAIDASSRGADGVRLADVDGDGWLDIATGWEEGGLVRVYTNPGPKKAAGAWPAVTAGEARAVEDAVLVDLDGDGRLDCVSSCEGKVRTVFFHWAPEDRAAYADPAAWRTEALPVSRDVMAWMFCVPLQLDGERGVDLIAGGKAKGAGVGWFEAPEDPRDAGSWKWHRLCDAGWIMSLVAIDFDRDGDRDVLVSDRKGAGRGCFWLENPGAGAEQRAAWRKHAVGGQGLEVMFLTVADVDGDRLEDVLVATRSKHVLELRREDAAGSSWAESRITLPASSGTAKAVAVADIDLDSRVDVVVSCENATGDKSGVLWFSRAPGGAGWQPHEISGPEGVKYDLVELLDLDADGDLDVLTCEERDNLGVIWYENPAR